MTMTVSMRTWCPLRLHLPLQLRLAGTCQQHPLTATRHRSGRMLSLLPRILAACLT